MTLELLGNPSETYITRGATYQASVNGIILVTNPSQYDVQDLLNSGCVFNFATGGVLLGRLLGANANATANTDQAFAMTRWASLVNFRITKITAKNSSANLTTANLGIYTGTLQGGTAIVAAQTFTGLTGPTLAINATIAATPANTALAPGLQLYLNPTTAQGAAATVDFYVWGDLFD